MEEEDQRKAIIKHLNMMEMISCVEKGMEILMETSLDDEGWMSQAGLGSCADFLVAFLDFLILHYQVLMNVRKKQQS